MVPRYESAVCWAWCMWLSIHSFMFDDVEMKLEKRQPLVVHDRIVHELVITLMIGLMSEDESSLFR